MALPLSDLLRVLQIWLRTSDSQRVQRGRNRDLELAFSLTNAGLNRGEASTGSEEHAGPGELELSCG